MLKNIFKNYLFDKSILVNDTGKDEAGAFPVLYSLATRLGISITSGHELATAEILEFASLTMGHFIPDAFYRGFPDSVRELSADQLLFDQLFHYFKTYGLGQFDEAGHSVFEKEFERVKFSEYYEKKSFKIVDEADAVALMKGYCDDIAKSTRPLNEYTYNALLEYVKDYSYMPESFASKDTLIRLVLDTKNLNLVKHLALSDVIKVTERILYDYDTEYDLENLNLKNSDRKLLTLIIDKIFECGKINVRDCYEKRKNWCGLLHHIHYKPKCDEAKDFLNSMRSGKNESVYSDFEGAMARGEVKTAADILLRSKGSGVLLRNLNYLLSRAKNDDDIDYVIEKVNSKNTILLIQLLASYVGYKYDEARTFKFYRYGLLVHHDESEDEQKKRKSLLGEELIKKITKVIRKKLESVLACKLGKVYIDPSMKLIALPLHESTSAGGYGCLPCGSRIKIPESKKIRAFTYWEKVNDIDLSMIGLDEDGKEIEFSWRTMFSRGNNDGIVFSGDQTSGFEGGSEYFDVDIKMLKKSYPKIKYLICSNNVYSSVPFRDIICTAGYMTRDIDDSGEVFEPKTVKSSFKITADSTTAYLFAIDVKKREFVWLNLSDESMRRVAGSEDIGFLEDYINATDVINMADFFTMLATEVVESPEDADIIVSDKDSDIVEGKEKIRSCDFERVMALMNS